MLIKRVFAKVEMTSKKLLIALGVLSVNSLLLAGCSSTTDVEDGSSARVESSSTSDIRGGSKLYNNGELWGTVVEVSDAHTFEDGTTEPGVLVDYGSRMPESVPPQWLPLRSAERFDIR